MEFGIGTRRRPIGRDYAAAKDAECGKKTKSEFGSQEFKHSVERNDVRRKRAEVGRWNVEVGNIMLIEFNGLIRSVE